MPDRTFVKRIGRVLKALFKGLSADEWRNPTLIIDDAIIDESADDVLGVAKVAQSQGYIEFDGDLARLTPSGVSFMSKLKVGG